MNEYYGKDCHTGSRGDKHGYYERVFTGPDERMG